MRNLRKWVPLALVLALVLVGAVMVGGCAKNEPAPTPTDTPETSDSTVPDIKNDTLTPGKLTIATGQPAYPPWVEDDKPESGAGFEAAVAYAIADKLGFAKEDVVWVRTDFEAAIAPGPKDFDFNIQQYSATEERRQAVDFSSPYYVTSQAVVTTTDSAFANAKSLADLAGAKVGAASGSSSLEIAQEKFGNDAVAVFNDVDTSVQALSVGQIDAIVVDIPTAHYVISAQIDNGKLVGEIAGSEGGDELAVLLPKDSVLTTAVSAAVDELRADGTLSSLSEQWLVSNADAVVLQ
ncbi:MAG: ABC transporter substrate-binding protein [Actinomycetes bacterium]|jgi:polar amino acid transport system substrate-binding protein|nr:ABC transporter substrate-binding protein [Actinomycetes bacterium]